MYQNYIFDFYGTLADIRTDEENPFLWKKMSEIYSAFGAAYEAVELQQAFRGYLLFYTRGNRFPVIRYRQK